MPAIDTTIAQWNENPEFNSRPYEDRRRIVENYFDDMVDDSFHDLPDGRKSRIKTNFVAENLGGAPAQQPVEGGAQPGISFESDPEFSFGRLGSQMGRAAGQGIADVLRSEKAFEQHRDIPAEVEFMRGEGFSNETPMQRQERLLARADAMKRGESGKASDVAAMEAERSRNVKSLDKTAEAFPEMLPGSSGRLEDALAGMARFAPAMATSFFSPAIGTTVTFSQIMGMSYDDYIKQGYDEEKSFNAAVINSLAQTPLEMAGNLLEIGAIKRIAGSVFKTQKPALNRLLAFGGAMLQSAAAEGAEEYLQQYPDEIAQIYLEFPDRPVEDIANEVVRRIGEIHEHAKDAALTGALGGAILTGVGGGVVHGAGAVSNLRKDKTIDIMKQGDKDLADAVNKIIVPEGEEAAPEGETPEAPKRPQSGIDLFEAHTEGEGRRMQADIERQRAGAPPIPADQQARIDNQRLMDQGISFEEDRLSGKSAEESADVFMNQRYPQPQRPTSFESPVDPLAMERELRGLDMTAPDERARETRSAKRTRDLMAVGSVEAQRMLNEHERTLQTMGRGTLDTDQIAQLQDIIGQGQRSQSQGVDFESLDETGRWVEPTDEEVARWNEMRSKARTEKIDSAANQAATSPKNDLPEPTEGQIEAGNYKKGHVKVQGMDITIENPKGSTRSGTDAQGNEWSTDMQDHYGYFKRSEGKDGDQVDVFIGPEAETGKAFIVDQVDPETGKFDEHKVMLGYPDEQAAREGYARNYDDGWQGLGAITEIPVDELKKWVKEGRKGKPYGKIPTPAVSTQGAGETQSLTDTLKGMVDERGNFSRGTDIIKRMAKDLPDSEVIDALKWAKSDDVSRHVERWVAPELAAELRSRGVPVDEIAWQQENIRAQQPTEQPAPKKAPSRKQGAQTIRGRIKEMGNIKVGNMAAELKEAPVAVKYLTRKNSGLPLDIVEKSLKEEGWMSEGESLVDILVDGQRAGEFLKRRHLGNDITQREGSQLTDREKQIKQEMEWEPEEPPPGEYVRVKAEDLPLGKKITILEDQSAEGWDEYEITEKDPFGVTLKDGTTIELSPLDEVDVRKEDLESGPALELKQDKYGKQKRRVEGGIKSTRSKKKLDEDTYFNTPSNRDKAQGGIPFENPRKRGLFDQPAQTKRESVEQYSTKRMIEKSEFIENDKTFKTGNAVTFQYLHNKESATDLFGVPDKSSPFDRGYEPSGKYVSSISRIPSFAKEDPVKYEYGEITFKNPLVIKHEGWKRSLSESYGGKTGKKLSAAIIKDGYDGIVTVDKNGTSEILDLTTFDIKKARYSTRTPEQASESPQGGVSSKKIKRIIDSQEYGQEEYEVYGLRVMSRSPKTGKAETVEVGDTLGNSYAWPDGEPSEEVLNGASAVEINLDDIDDAIKKVSNYDHNGDKIVLIGSDNYGYGTDSYNDEILVRDGRVLGVFDIPDQSGPPNQGGKYASTTPQQAADRHNLWFDGPQERPGKSPLLQFTDKTTGDTFNVQDLSEVPAKVSEIRSKALSKAQDNFQSVTRQDVKDFFKNVKNSSVRKRRTDGAIIVQIGNRTPLRIKNVANIAIDEAAFEVEYGRKPGQGEMAAGSYQSGEIKISRIGDRYSLAHESFHWMSDIGVLNRADIRAIDKAIGNENATEEDRAKWFEAQRMKRDQKGRLAKAIQKIQDFIDSIVNLFHRTARGVIRDVDSGRVFNQKKTGINEFAQSAKLSVKKAAKNIMENPKFRKWFGDSKVTDENGKPLVVYHGTHSDINIFKRTRGAHLGFHFGDQEAANTRLEDTADKRINEKSYADMDARTERLFREWRNFEDELRSRDGQIPPDEFLEKLQAGVDVNDILEPYRYKPTKEEREKLDSLKDAYDKSKPPIHKLGDGSRIGAYYLSIKKPIRLRDVGNWGSPKTVRNELPWGSYARTLSDIRDEIIQHGYDGIVYQNIVENPVMRTDSYVAFEPNQIKSIYNTTFDPQNPDIRYQSKALRDGMPLYQTKVDGQTEEQWVVEKVKDMGIRESQTRPPHWLAKKYHEFDLMYRRQQQRVKDRIRHLSQAVEEVKDFFSMRKGPEADQLRNLIWTLENQQVVKTSKLKKGEDGTYSLNPQHYIDLRKKLDEIKGLSDKVKTVYVELRKSLDQDFATVLNTMKAMPDIEESAVTDYRRAIGKIHNYFPHMRYGNRYFAIYDFKTEKTSDGKYRCVKGGKTLSISSKENEAIDTALGNGGHVLYREHFNSATGSLRKIKAAIKNSDEINAIKNEHPETTFRAGKVEKLPEEVFAIPVPIEAIEAVMNAAADRMTDNQAKESFRRLMPQAVADALKSRGWGSHMINRKNIPGFEKGDIKRVLFDYKSGLYGWLTKMEVARDFSKTMKDVQPKKKPKLWAAMRDYSYDMLENADSVDRTVDTLRSIFFAKYLGANFKTAALNTTQNIIAGWPRLGMEVGNSFGKTMSGAASDIVNFITRGHGLSADEQQLLKDLYEEGNTHAQFLSEVRGQIGNNVYSLANKAMYVLGLPMQVAEGFNRRSLAIAAFRAATKGKIKNASTLEGYGYERGQGFSYQDAKDFAETVVNDAHFVYGKTNRPGMFRGSSTAKIASSAYTFRTFSHNLINLWRWMYDQGGPGKRAVIKSMGAMFAIGGMTSIPLYKTVMHLIRQMTGDDPEDEIVGLVPEGQNGLRDILLYGLPAAAGVTLGGSIGMEVPVFDKIQLRKSITEQLMRNAGEIVGVPWAVIEDAESALTALNAGQGLRAFEYLAPTVLSNIAKGYRMATEGQRSITGKPINIPGKGDARKLSAMEALGKAAGFQPVSSTKAYDVYKKLEDFKAYRTGKVSGFANKLANALVGKDKKEFDRVAKNLAEWNKEQIQQRRPEYVITYDDINRALSNRSRVGQPPQYLLPKAMKLRKQYFN